MTIRHQVEATAPAQTLTFKCLGHTKRGDLVESYLLEVTDTRSGKTATISVGPRQLASARSMKKILLERCMFYKAARAEHDQTLLEILHPQSASIQELP